MKNAKSQTTYSGYQKIVRNLAWKRFKNDHPVFDLIAPLIVGILVGLWESFRLAGKIEFLTTGLVTAMFTFCIYSVVYLWYFSREHFFIYNEQINRIEWFWPETLDINVDYDLDMKEVLDDRGNKITAAGFTTINAGKKHQVVELTAKIKSIAQTSFDPDSGEVITLPFFPDRKVVWENGETLVALRPDQSMSFNFAYLDLESPSKLHFGEGGFVWWLFDREAIYQFDIEFIGKIEGAIEFRRYHYMNVLYANPSKNKLLIALLAKERHLDEIPIPFLQIIEAAKESYWYDYSSPFQRRQAEKQNEARIAKAAEQSAQRTGRILARFRAFFKPRKNPAPK